MDIISDVLSRGSIDFSTPTRVLLGVPFYAIFLRWSLKKIQNFSFLRRNKLFYTIGSDCVIKHDQNGDASFYAVHTIIFSNHHDGDLTSLDFPLPVIITGDKPFDLLSLKKYSSDEYTKFEAQFDSAKNEVSISPIFISKKSYLKIELEYHSSEEVNFETKIILKDGVKRNEKLDVHYKLGEHYASFSINWGNWINFIPLIAFPFALVFYLPIVFSFKLTYPITENIIINPIFGLLYGGNLIYVFRRLREMEKDQLAIFKLKKWTEII